MKSKKRLLYFILCLIIIVIDPAAALAQTTNGYCERVDAESSNECIKTMLKQGILYFDPAGTGSQSCSTSGALGAGLGLGYPGYSNEAQMATMIEDLIRKKRPNSPWLTVPDLGQKIVNRGKEYNANPFIMLAIGWIESHFSTDDTTAVRLKNPFGQKGPGGENGYREFLTIEAGLFNEKDLLSGLQTRLSGDPVNYKDVKSMYEYFSVHNTGKILYPGDNYRAEDPSMPGSFVSSELDAVYGPVPYWRTSMELYNDLFGTSVSTLPPSRSSAGVAVSGDSCGSGDGQYPAGPNGWDLPGEGPNPLAYYSQLYKCGETTEPGREFAQACDDEAIGDNAFGSYPYGTGTIELCGCGPTSFASVVTTLTGIETTPDKMAVWADNNGGVQSDGCGSSFFWTTEIAQTEFGVVSEEITTSEIASTLRSGKLVMVSLDRFPTEDNAVGHISIIRKVDENSNFYFADSYAGAWGNEPPETASRTPYTEAQIANMVKGVWSVGAK